MQEISTVTLTCPCGATAEIQDASATGMFITSESERFYAAHKDHNKGTSGSKPPDPPLNPSNVGA